MRGRWLQERLADEMERSEAFETDLQKSAARAGELQARRCLLNLS